MASFTPPLYNSDVFNPYLFDYASESLTLADADKRYLKQTGGAITGNLFVSGVIDCGTLTIGGSPVDLSYITGITPGAATASKALVLDASKNITGISLISSTSILGTTLTLGGASLTSTQINYLTSITIGTASASKALVLDSNSRINFDVNTTYSSAQALTWYGGTANQLKAYMYRGDDTTGMIIGFQNVSASTNRTTSLLRLKCSLDPSTQVAGLSAYTYSSLFTIDFADKPATGWANWNFGIGAKQGYTFPWASGYPSLQSITTSCYAVNLCCGSNTPDTSTNNILITSDAKYCFNTTTPNGAYQLTLNAPSASINGIYMSGDGTMLKLDNIGGTGGRSEIQFQGNVELWQIGAGNSTHTAASSFYIYNGAYRMLIDTSGRVGIGTTAPSTYLDVASSNSVTTTTNIAVNTYYYNVSANTWTNGGGGPFSATMCARFRSNVWIQDKIYATSDRRLKEDIKALDFKLSHFKKLRPVSYRFKNDEQIKLGLIAQELLPICSEAITVMPNDNMKKENDDDVEGGQYTVDYHCINMMNTVAIKKLIEKIDELEAKIATLI